MKGILICGEFKKGSITSISRELIATGRSLREAADLPLHFLLIGENPRLAAQEAARMGPNKILTVEGSAFADFHPDRLTAAVYGVCERIEPGIILFGQTDMGRDVAPRLAAKLEASICMDCVDLAFDETGETLLQTKPVYGGNALARWASPNLFPHVVTMRPRSNQPAEPDPSCSGEIESIAIEIDETRIPATLVKTVREDDKGVTLEDAAVIVAGGGGIGGSEGFRLVEELAKTLHAAVGITRVPSDENWMPKKLEVGQTGHIVSPDLYIAVGISGAPQHLAGCANSKLIVAINKDPQARIFEEADLGIVGDYREVLPPLIQRIRDLKD